MTYIQTFQVLKNKIDMKVLLVQAEHIEAILYFSVMFRQNNSNRYQVFLRLCGESNEHGKKVMKTRYTTLFGGQKWKNIMLEEMVNFFCILLQILLEPRKMRGYDSYFSNSHTIILASDYISTLHGYNAWTKNIVSLVIFK